MKLRKKIRNPDKYITTPKLNKLTVESFAVNLKRANLVTILIIN